MLFLQDVTTTIPTSTEDLRVLWWASGRSCFDSIIPCERVDVCQWTSMSECSPPLCGVGGALHQADLPRIVGPGQSQLHHQLWQESDEHGDHLSGYPCHQWGRWREPWNGDHLLPLWPGEGRAFSHASDPCPVGLTSASHGGDEDLHQLALFPLGVLWPPLAGSSHPARGCLNHLISTFMALPVLAAPVFPHSGHPA